MKCVKCGSKNCKLFDTRKNVEQTVTRRKRRCLDCGKEWETYEFDSTTVYTGDVKQLANDWRQGKPGE